MCAQSPLGPLLHKPGRGGEGEGREGRGGGGERGEEEREGRGGEGRGGEGRGGEGRGGEGSGGEGEGREGRKRRRERGRKGEEGLLLNQGNAGFLLGTFESSMSDHTVWAIWLCRSGRSMDSHQIF